MPKNVTHPPLSDLETSNLLSKRQHPQLTFGLEMELDFSVARHLYFDWLATLPNIPPYPDDTDMDDLPTRSTDHWVTARERYNDRIVWGLQDPSPTFSQATYSTESTDSQASANLRQNLLQYLLAFLNRELSTSKQGKMLIGNVVWGGNPKTAMSEVWTVVNDDSVAPGREAYGQTFQPAQPYHVIRQFFRCVGAELVSKVYAFDGLENEVFPALKELHEDMEDDYQHGAWFTGETHLHVHFGIENEEITLELAQTLCALYGLFENQIERFVKNSQRESPWCRRLRKGMEGRQMYTAPITLTGDVDLAMRPERRYTQEGFTDEVYDTRSLQELKSLMSGYSAGEDIPNKPIPILGVREWTALNISVARDNTPTTFEFRHHHGTSDPEEIKFWVQLCGNMLRFAYLLTQLGIKLKDPVADTANNGSGPTCLEDWTKKDILDIVGMSNEAKAHFWAQTQKFHDNANDSERDVEEWMIAKRVQRRKAGEETGIFMDSEIVASPEYKILQRYHPLLQFPPHPPLTDDDQLILGLQNVFAVIERKLIPDHRRRPRDYEDLKENASRDGTGQLAVWLNYQTYILTEDRRRAGNRGTECAVM
ncbi:hypothetical protein BKA65DRAFT_562782 [Rhexocercosporidium sp. MPI-PUGE-AT-0058]|nr:hypothetical protein BKA65DRAFT_562782 [Rhexocercosporidium sp. MPI-PUGE-AT-0058]